MNHEYLIIFGNCEDNVKPTAASAAPNCAIFSAFVSAITPRADNLLALGDADAMLGRVIFVPVEPT